MTFAAFSQKDINLLFEGFSISSLFYNFLIEMLSVFNIPVKEMEKYTRFKIEPVKDGKRVSIIKAYKIWKGMEKLSGRSDIGLLVADYFTIEKAGIAGELFIHTKNLRESVNVMKRFLSILINNINTKYTETGDKAIFYFDIIPRFIIPLSVSECYAKICYNWLREYTGLKTLPLIEINFYGKTPKHTAFYTDTFPNVKVSFNQYTNYIILKKSIFYKPNSRSLQYPYEYTLKHAQNIKKEIFTKHSCTHKIINNIITSLPEGTNHIDHIAENLNISTSTIKRRLKDENTTFSKLTELIRKKLSFYMLQDKELSFEEISYLLGYSEYSSFFRAFKKWYHKSPSEFRESF
jgi:AraC-like DNA-binding protein